MMKKLLITGGAGFIGSNLAKYFADRDYQVFIFDNFMRFGTKDNCRWLKKENPEITVIEGDIRDARATQKAASGMDIIFHLAAQVAVTTSVTDPRCDFELNALGTFNMLEGARKSSMKPIFIFSSTNKVYGGMDGVGIVEKNGEYTYRDLPYGVSESMNLDFHSPYGCSKGAADQYVRDYARIYGLPTVVFRQSCIYGPRQFGIEDQGWVAWFIIASAFGRKISIYGDGKQVRDVLYVADLVRLFEIAVNKIKIAQGKIYNVGGGRNNVLSVWHGFGPILTRLFGKDLHPVFADWRPGDQKVYISDTRKVKKELGWEPKINIEEGIEKLFHWVNQNKQLFNQFFR